MLDQVSECLSESFYWMRNLPQHSSMQRPKDKPAMILLVCSTTTLWAETIVKSVSHKISLTISRVETVYVDGLFCIRLLCRHPMFSSKCGSDSMDQIQCLQCSCYCGDDFVRPSSAISCCIACQMGEAYSWQKSRHSTGTTLVYRHHIILNTWTTSLKQHFTARYCEPHLD